jgi:hypothetical protein
MQKESGIKNQQSILGYFKEIRPDHNELVPALENDDSDCTMRA